MSQHLASVVPIPEDSAFQAQEARFQRWWDEFWIPQQQNAVRDAAAQHLPAADQARMEELLLLSDTGELTPEGTTELQVLRTAAEKGMVDKWGESGEEGDREQLAAWQAQTARSDAAMEANKADPMPPGDPIIWRVSQLPEGVYKDAVLRSAGNRLRGCRSGRLGGCGSGRGQPHSADHGLGPQGRA